MGTFRSGVRSAAVKKGTKLSILQGTYFIAPGARTSTKTGRGMGAGQRGRGSADFLNWPDCSPRSPPPSRRAGTTSWSCGRDGIICTRKI